MCGWFSVLVFFFQGVYPSYDVESARGRMNARSNRLGIVRTILLVSISSVTARSLCRSLVFSAEDGDSDLWSSTGGSFSFMGSAVGEGSDFGSSSYCGARRGERRRLAALVLKPPFPTAMGNVLTRGAWLDVFQPRGSDGAVKHTY